MDKEEEGDDKVVVQDGNWQSSYDAAPPLGLLLKLPSNPGFHKILWILEFKTKPVRRLSKLPSWLLGLAISSLQSTL